MKSGEWTAAIVGASVLACGISLVTGCTADPRDVLKAVKEIEPDAEKRNQEIRELTGVPEEEESK